MEEFKLSWIITAEYEILLEEKKENGEDGSLYNLKNNEE